MRLQVDADLFNVFNGQTGYNRQPGVHTGVAFGVSRNFFDPRRFQIAARCVLTRRDPSDSDPIPSLSSVGQSSQAAER